ncbi:class I SAM-dependent methyltransferase [bacterium]|nr:class I SAM-dependent methyltransferase [bacterium]
MDVKSQAYVAEAVKRHPIKGPVLEIAAGWEPNYYRPLFGDLEYVKQDIRQWDPPTIEIIGDAKDLRGKVGDGSFNTILCVNTLEHIDEPHKVADEIFRILAVGGHAIVTVPCRCPIHRAPKDYWRPMPDGMFFLFRRFEILDMMLGRSATYPSTINMVVRKAQQPVEREDFPYEVIRTKRENSAIVNFIDAITERFNIQFIRLR